MHFCVGSYFLLFVLLLLLFVQSYTSNVYWIEFGIRIKQGTSLVWIDIALCQQSVGRSIHDKANE